MPWNQLEAVIERLFLNQGMAENLSASQQFRNSLHANIGTT